MSTTDPASPEHRRASLMREANAAPAERTSSGAETRTSEAGAAPSAIDYPGVTAGKDEHDRARERGASPEMPPWPGVYRARGVHAGYGNPKINVLFELSEDGGWYERASVEAWRDAALARIAALERSLSKQRHAFEIACRHGDEKSDRIAALEAENARLTSRLSRTEELWLKHTSEMVPIMESREDAWSENERIKAENARLRESSAAARRDEQGEAGGTDGGAEVHGESRRLSPCPQGPAVATAIDGGTIAPSVTHGPRREDAADSNGPASPSPAPQATRETDCDTCGGAKDEPQDVEVEGGTYTDDGKIRCPSMFHDPSPAAGSARAIAEKHAAAAVEALIMHTRVTGGSFVCGCRKCVADRLEADILAIFAPPAPVAVTREMLRVVVLHAGFLPWQDALLDDFARALNARLSAPVSAEALERACKQAYLSRPFARSWEHDADRMARIGEARALLKQLGIATEGT